MPQRRTNQLPLVLAFVAVIALTVLLLRLQGRLWVCDCGYVALWVSRARDPETSQQLFDPYSFTHLLHGFAFAWLCAWLLPRLSFGWQLLIATVVEALWEVVENSEIIIRRYREATAALGYFGDTIVNSLGDIVACALGFVVAHYLGPRRAVVVFILVEIILIFWIRDSLILNIIMLLFPIDSIKQWQNGG